jgi:hypothetical protein
LLEDDHHMINWCVVCLQNFSTDGGWPSSEKVSLIQEWNFVNNITPFAVEICSSLEIIMILLPAPNHSRLKANLLSYSTWSTLSRIIRAFVWCSLICIKLEVLEALNVWRCSLPTIWSWVCLSAPIRPSCL